MSQKRKNFILLVEIVERELPASVLVGAELAGRGHNVWLIEKGRFRKSPASFPPSIVLEKGLSKGCLSRFRSIRGAGHVLAVMCQEGFTYRSGDDYIQRRVHAETIDNIDYLFLWGERQKQDLERFLGKVRGFHVTGNPRIDLLHSRFRKSWQAEAEAIRETHGDFVLFTSRFSAVNHFRRSLDETLDRRKEQYTDAAEATIGERLRDPQTSFCGLHADRRGHRPRLPDLKFVVRPHPVENADVWRERFAGAGNVEIRDERLGDAVAQRRALCRSQRLHHRHRGLSARSAGDRISSGRIPRGEFDPVFPGQVTGSVHSVDDLAEWIEAHAGGDAPVARDAKTDDLIAFYLQNDRRPDAYRDMADALEGFQGPGILATLRNRLSGKHDARKMQQRHFGVEDVDRLLKAYVACDLRDKFTPAVLDEVGIRLVS